MKMHVITSWEEGTDVQQFSSQMKIILYCIFDAADTDINLEVEDTRFRV